MRELLFPDVPEEGIDAALDALGFLGDLVRPGLRDTVAPTTLRAGLKSNVIPGEAVAGLDVRMLPGHDEELRRTVAALAGADAEVEWPSWRPAVAAPAEGPLLTAIEQAIAAEDPGAVVAPFLLPASTDNKSFAPLGIAGYGFVPLRVPDDFDVYGQFHAADERIPVDSLRFCARTTARLLATA